MAMIAIPVSKDISSLFERIDVPGKRDSSDHCTIFYLGKNVSIKKIVKLVPIIYDITKNMKPFNISSNTLSTFPEGKNGYPIIAKINSNDLISFRDKLKKEFDKNKIKYDTKFKDYKPHVTLSYSEENIKDIKFSKIIWQVNSIGVYGDDNDLYINFPFSLGIQKKAAYIEELADWLNQEVKNKT